MLGKPGELAITSEVYKPLFYLDISAAVHSKAGLGRYSERLAHALIAQQPDRFALFYNGKDAKGMLQSFAGTPQKGIGLGYKPWRTAIALAHLAQLPFNTLIPNAQLFHSTEHLLMPLSGIPTVLTVHDLIYKLFPAYHKRGNYWYLNLFMPLYCRRATAIIAVSEATKRDLITHYALPPDKIHVVYEAAAPHFHPPSSAQIAFVRQKYGLPEQFLLHLATIEPRKNLARLLDACQIVRRDFPQLQLLLAGGKGWLYDDFFAKIEQEGLADWVKPLGWVPDEELPALIAAASLGVQPSLYEGFGLPILEQMAVGQVVAASNASSHPEVGGVAAAYFDPTNTEEMSMVIYRLLTHPDEYHYRQQLGLTQAAQFSWQQAAQKTTAVYDQLAHYSS